ncbi:Lar family restriction alleviation protein [Azospirillum sp. A1-3]|uniref:Lar family restriction alleviation protein n=1 Tax=Azospirillum sp. A1-3 TaxID=185874 RepID=UPI0020776E6A|nr:Lar family restriction alleviation protein [Azospirillum sp. A1-3]MCM8734627.1 Lar family restriction alleviation protein [Azospirillum sp. A1-3]
MTETAALLPCPMCSEKRIGFGDTKYSPATVLEHGWSQNVFHFVNCPSCGLNNKGVIGHATKEDAAAAWNRRATPPASTPSDTITAAEAAHSRGRDAFAAWWNAANRDQRLQVVDGARHLLGALSATPAGWRLAPVEPTDAMMNAGEEAYRNEYIAYEGAIPHDVVCHSVMRAMLEAAPTAAPSPAPQEAPPSREPLAWWAETGTAGAGEGCNKPFWLRHEAIAYVCAHGGHVAPLFPATPAAGEGREGWEADAQFLDGMKSHPIPDLPQEPAR